MNNIELLTLLECLKLNISFSKSEDKEIQETRLEELENMLERIIKEISNGA